jgi:hypothetical protein
MQNFRSFCEIMEGPSKDLKIYFTSSMFVFLPRFWTTIFWPVFLEIIRRQNPKFECVRRETTQDVHSGRRNGALNDRKRRFTALIFTVFHRNPSVRITTAVSGRFLLRNDHRFTPFLYTFLDWRITTAVSGRFSPVYSRFRPFTRRSVGPGEEEKKKKTRAGLH